MCLCTIIQTLIKKKKKLSGFPNIDLNYKKLSFKNTENVCYKKLTELSIHNPVKKPHLDFLIKNLDSFEKAYGK